MFTPNLDCWITPVSKDANLYGELGKGARKKERCGVVKLRHEIQHSTVRADSSASRGHAEEFTVSNVILLQANTVAVLRSKLEVSGVSMRIMSIFPRYDVSGKLDHYEVQGEVWV